MAILSSYLPLLQLHHIAARKAVAGLSPEALDWHTDNLPNSLTVLASHLAGSERYWIGDVIAGQASDRDRSAEFKARGASEAELGRLIEQTEQFTATVLATLDESVLGSMRRSSSAGLPRDVTVAWVLLHVLEHTAYHVGQMSVLRKAYLDAMGG